MAYNVVFPDQIVKAGDLSGNLQSPAFYIQNQDNIGFQLNWTGVPVGTFAVQTSADYKEDSQGNILNTGHWIDIPLTMVITAFGGPDQAVIYLYQLSTPWIRVTYSSTSGTGLFDLYATSKGV